MELREFMITSGVRTKFFAESLGISTGFLNGVASHRYRPSWTLAKQIEKVTKGKVTAMQLMQLTYIKDKV